MKRFRVKSIMTSSPYRINIDDSISKAYKMIKEFKIRHLPVMENKKVVGIISSTDISKYHLPSLESSLHFTPHSLKAKDIMTSPVRTLKEDDQLDSFVNEFIQEKYRSLPVVDSDNELIGILSASDVISALYKSNS